MSEEQKISLRDKIIEASRNLLLDEGYRGFSLRKVARKIGVSATSIYLHFEGKDDLIHTLIDESIQKLNAKLAETASKEEDPVERLEVLAWTYTNFALENPREYLIIYVVSSDEMTRYPKEKFRKARQGYELLTETIEDGVIKGIMDEEDPRIASYTFWAQLHGVMSVVLTKRLDSRIDQTAFLEQAIQHIIDGFHVRTSVDK
ncbi:TetR/AcrR family transcriptional regulator [Aliifodinibius sp. S!AR15-10]|uniref:TetR/AcrR family transcriptional regulator n=1 Tax=Aliifodinibius sp. S!AR15-10 TaxID=2950437 RepID=UPI002862BF57|nr:TetR/AcrR family transcriptional regulator [Aliifodinibius sp. S!AR15-10]MDR8393548.1 TetR/AcrR family transcriptional regulator [Aliifodinibius sp. S!AR15-10]